MNLFIIKSLISIALCSSISFAGLTKDESRKLCIELGLTPESITVLGLNGASTDIAFDRLSDEEATANQLRQLQSQSQELLSSMRDAQRSIRYIEDQLDADRLQADIDAAENQIQSIAAHIEALSDQLRYVFLPAGVDQQLVTRVCEATGLALFVPAEFRVLPLLNDDYSEIYAALLAEKQALAEGIQLDTDTQLTLSRFRNLPAVQAARSNLLYNLDAVRGAYYN